MEDALRARRRVFGTGAVLAGLLWALIHQLGSRVGGPVVSLGVNDELVLAGAGALCAAAAAFLLAMKPALVDQIIDSRSRQDRSQPALTLRALSRQLSLMGAGLGWSVLTAGYVAVSLTGLYRTYAAFVLLAVVIGAAAAMKVRGLLDYAAGQGVDG